MLLDLSVFTSAKNWSLYFNNLNVIIYILSVKTQLKIFSHHLAVKYMCGNAEGLNRTEFRVSLLFGYEAKQSALYPLQEQQEVEM